MTFDKAKIGNNIYDVISEEEYLRNPSLYEKYTAIKRGDGYIYPVIDSCSNEDAFKVGYHPLGCINLFVLPETETDKDKYSDESIIPFHDITHIKEMINSQQILYNAERSILTNIDNLYVPAIGENDAPEMVALKQAIIDKHIDLDKYEPRFGPNYNNDKRLLSKENLTIGKLRTFCKALDMKATLTIEDANPDVPNPIGRVITTELTDSNKMSIDGEES